MDRLDELALLIAIVDGGSLAAAARKTRRSAAVVTRTLRDLEKRLGAPLIERNTRRLAPTQAGRELVEHARRLVAGYGEAIDAIAAGTTMLRGGLRLSAPIVFGKRHVAPVVTRFLAAHPHVAIELLLADQIVDLAKSEADVALRIGELGESALVAKSVGHVRRIVVASPDYLARHGEPRHIADLEKHEVITQMREGVALEWRFALPKRGVTSVRPRGRFTVNSAEAAIEAACAGLGLCAPLSYQVVDELNKGRLLRVLREIEPPPLPINLVYARSRLTARTRTFVDFALAELAKVSRGGWV